MSSETIDDMGQDRSGVGRRAFLGGGLGVLVTFALEAGGGGPLAKAMAAPAVPAGLAGTTPTTAAVNGWVRINADNTVTIAFGGAEMGQGIMTGLAQGVAEELMVDWAQVRTEAAPTAQSYVTGGSFGVRANLAKMRVAGAQAKHKLVTAAANQWGISTSQCTAAKGIVTNGATGATLTYAQLAADAAGIDAPAAPTLTDPSQFRIIGTSAGRVDLPSKTDGSAVFGIDVKVPGMVYAAVKHCPTVGGTLKATPAVPAGCDAVVPLGNAVAVVAKNTWAAIKGANAMSVSWTTPSTASAMTTSTMLANQQKLMASGTPGSPVAEQVGDAPGAYAAAAKKLEATYQVPYLPHVCMEVLNCTASVTATSAEVWVPTQAASWVVGTVTALTGLPASAVTVHPTLLGGGLGRKIEQDYVAEAVRVAKAIGKPVKLTWTREEDLAHDQYRPSGLVRIRMGLDGTGAVTSFADRIVTPSPLYQRGWIPATGNDNVDGAKDLPYAFPARLVEYVLDPAGVPVGFWRSVGESINCFAVESAMDEAAALAGMDPLAFRQKHLAEGTRPRTVLDAAAAMIGWSTPPAAGVGRGIALGTGFGSIAAMAVEVSQPSAGVLKVNRVTCAVDCGIAVNPSQVEGQIQGGIIHGISAALWGRTTFSSGKASSRNFSNTRLLKMKETPAIEVKVIQSGIDKLGGIGEVGVPPMAPALANAWKALTGTRIRTLPMFPSQGTMGG
ncbi:MAG: molybdopterin cofactor-binding domain-containing protein [Acidimicrobiales bacterium]